MAISLKPRFAEAEPGSSLASMKCSPLILRQLVVPA